MTNGALVTAAKRSIRFAALIVERIGRFLILLTPRVARESYGFCHAGPVGHPRAFYGHRPRLSPFRQSPACLDELPPVRHRAAQYVSRRLLQLSVQRRGP